MTREVIDRPPFLDGDSYRITGNLKQTRHGPVEEFLGVQYARAERFRPPIPCQPGPGVVHAHDFGPAAPQWSRSGLRRTSELDCLNLNVWRPKGANSRPVMVWIHGGGYESGSNAEPATLGANLAARHGVIVVSLNYRLGAFGFLALGEVFKDSFPESPNLAILDLITGLRWIRDHAALIGGDSDRITIFGQSAGGAAVATLLGSPVTEGLFRRAIIQSGTAERVRTLEDSLSISRRLLALLEIKPVDRKYLLSIPTHILLEAQHQLSQSLGSRRISYVAAFQPTMDGRLIPDLPYRTIADGVNQQADVIVGTNLNEGTDAVPLTATDQEAHAFPQSLEEMMADDNLEANTMNAYVDALRKQLGRTLSVAETIESYRTDNMQRQPSNRLLQARTNAEGHTYSYLFTWADPAAPDRGAAHSLELDAIFDHPVAAITGRSATAMPETLTDSMSARWTAFAGTGIPNGGSIDWPEYWPDRDTMSFGAEEQICRDPWGDIRKLLVSSTVNSLQ